MFAINTIAEHYKKMRMTEYKAYQVVKYAFKVSNCLLNGGRMMKSLQDYKSKRDRNMKKTIKQEGYERKWLLQ